MEKIGRTLKKAGNFCIKWRYVIALGAFILGVAFQLHGSSIAIYNDMFDNAEEYNARSVILGKARSIRGDEYVVHTPYYMSQVYNDFGKTSHMMSLEGQDMIIGYNAPVLDITMIAKPFTWGYMLLGNEYGLSWYWCMKLILLMLVSFELCMILTKGNKRLSVLGVFLIALSPLMQWWFVPHMCDVFFWGMALLVLAYHFFTAKNLVYKNLFMILLPLAVVTFVIALFPSLQISVGLTAIALLIAFLIRDKKEITFSKRDIWRIVLMVMIAGGILGYFVVTSFDEIKLLFNTAYPGKRVSLGGNNVIKDLFTDLTTFTLPFKNITYSNNCEVSTFIHFAPLFLMLYPLIRKKMAKDENMIVGKVLLGVIAVMAVFMLAGFPELLAKVTFFSYINRMKIAYGFVATLFTIWGISMIWKKKIISNKAIVISLVAYGLLYVCFIGEKELTYLAWWRYGVIIAGVLVMAFLMLKGFRKLFSLAVIMVIAISSLTINPIARGVSPLFDHPLEQKIAEIAKDDGEAYWLAIGSTNLAALGISNGAKVLNMTNFYPDYAKWGILDPEGQYDEVYNRYAHISTSLTKDETKISKAVNADAMILSLNYDDLLKLPVKYLVSQGKLDTDKLKFEEIYKDSEGDYYIYRRV